MSFDMDRIQVVNLNIAGRRLRRLCGRLRQAPTAVPRRNYHNALQVVYRSPQFFGSVFVLPYSVAPLTG